MNVNHLSLAGVLTCMALFSSQAMATCPPYYDNDCDGGSGTDICQLGGSGAIICMLDRNSGAGNTELWAISPSSSTMTVYGTDQAGYDFCCEYSSLSASDQLLVYGSDQSDAIRLADARYGLETVQAYVDGNLGADAIYGSTETTLASCVLDGGGHNDLILGGPGAEDIYGGIGQDTIDAGAGDDYVSGGAGNDHIKGGVGDDELDGGDDNDKICGGVGADTLLGNDGDYDELYNGEDAGDSDNGGAGTSDVCTSPGPWPGCVSSTLTSCPW